jgi:hypothetical protein
MRHQAGPEPPYDPKGRHVGTRGGYMGTKGGYMGTKGAEEQDQRSNEASVDLRRCFCFSLLHGRLMVAVTAT